ncbi:hypothetical protein V1512DRAFT_256430 [Lipomyces arxii]|uniref:uncharacterized protein n=1 Tax=Lipomyces arxii TaxID=56418 RepID=UPI0034CDCDA9
MAPVPYGELVKNEIEPRSPRPSNPVKSEFTKHGDGDNDVSERERKRPKSDDPYASLRRQMTALAKHPEKEVLIPRPQSPLELLAPPEFVNNVQGSSAGAGSGEFHVYKQSRRREMERSKIFEDQIEKERVQSEFELKKKMQEEADAKRTEKKREKRRKRGKASGARQSAVSNTTVSPTVAEDSDKSDKSDKKPEPENKEQAAPVDGEINLMITDDFEM